MSVLLLPDGARLLYPDGGRILLALEPTISQLKATYYASLSDFATATGGVDLGGIEDRAIAQLFTASLRDLGFGSLTQQNDATTIPAITDTDIGVLAWSLDATPIGWTLVDDRQRVSIHPDEEKAHTTTVSGPGGLGLFAKGTVGPPGGDDRFPYASTIAFNYTHPDYVQDGSWVGANIITDWQTMHDYWVFITSGLFDIAPDFHGGSAVGLVSPQDGTSTDAPEGDWYYRALVNFPTTGFYTVEMVSDDDAELFIDGVPFMQNGGFAESASRTEFFTAGAKRISGHVHNFAAPGPDWFGGQNPSYVGVVCFPGGGNYRSSTPAWVSANTWYTNDYPADIPGMTPGKVGLLLLQEHIDAGRTWASLINPTFDETNDSNGDPWPTLHNITATVGEKVSETIRKMMTYAWDSAMGVDSLDWNAYALDGLNPASGLTLAAGQNISQLEHHTVAKVADEARTLSEALGFHVVGGGEVQGYLELGSEVAASEVDAITTPILDIYGRAQRSIDVSYFPRNGESPGEFPWVNANFVPGADITVPDEDDTPITERIQEITVTQSSDAENVAVSIVVADQIVDTLARLLEELRT